MSAVTKYAVIETALCIGSNLLEGEVFMVMATDHDRELAALREELAALTNTTEALINAKGDALLCLTAAEQRNAELVELLGGLLNAGDWYTSALEFARDESGFKWYDKIEAALKPTESGAS